MASTLEMDAPTSLKIKAFDHLLMSQNDDSNTSQKENRAMNEIKLLADYGSWAVVAGGTNRYNSLDRLQNRYFDLEKYSVQWESSQWKAKLGHSYLQLGQGIALSLFRDPVLGVDDTLEGAHASYQVESLKAQLFGGRLSTWKNPVALNPMNDKLEGKQILLGGAQISLSGESVQPQLYGFVAEQKSIEGRVETRYASVGNAWEFSEVIPETDIYLESNLLSRGEKQPLGIGSYVSIVPTLGSWRLKLEGKDYRNYEFAFRKAPTLEDEVVETLNTQNVSSGRMTVEKLVSETSLTFLGTSFALGIDRQQLYQYYHSTLFVKNIDASFMQVDAKAGHRSEGEYGKLWHGNVRLKTKHLGFRSTEFGFNKRSYAYNQVLFPALEDRNSWDVAFAITKEFNLGAGFDWIPSRDDQKYFGNLTLEWRAQSWNLKTFLGSTGGGTQCSLGICRQIPAYNGAYLELNLEV